MLTLAASRCDSRSSAALSPLAPGGAWDRVSAWFGEFDVAARRPRHELPHREGPHHLPLRKELDRGDGGRDAGHRDAERDRGPPPPQPRGEHRRQREADRARQRDRRGGERRVVQAVLQVQRQHQVEGEGGATEQQQAAEVEVAGVARGPAGGQTATAHRAIVYLPFR
ncbi:hypothetical protein [Dactylosporangium sp. NPDC050588]|uniref:hypothetical protein n=1 Tax=Dactylosporangium sp. NPDC050588 TaxID=3157211 RepID=UPI0033D20453